MSSDHFAPWSERQGESGLRLVVPRRGARADVAAVRRRQRAGPALPPGDHRPGRGDAVRDVPGAAVDRARLRRGVQRAHHGRAAGRARRSATRGCASARTSCARCSPARRSRTTGTSSSTARGCGRCPRRRRRCSCAAVSEADRALGRRVGRRAGDGQRAGRDAASGCSTRSAARAGRCCRSTSRGRRPRRRRSGSPTTSGARTSSTRRCAGTSTRPEAFDAAATVVRPEDLRRQGADLVRPGAARRVAAGVRRTRVRRHRDPPRRPGPRPVHRRVRRARPAAAR